MFLVFDTETTGFPRNKKAPLTDFDNWPRMVQIAWQLHDEFGELIEAKDFIVKPEGYDIPFSAEQVHGISTKKAQNEGYDLVFVLEEFNKALKQAQYCVGHNIEFDIPIVGCEYLRKEVKSNVTELPTLDTQLEGTEYCAIPGGFGGGFKWPKLFELHQKLFNEDFDEAHNATADVVATARCFLELIRHNVITPDKYGKPNTFIEEFRKINPNPIPPAEVEIKEQVGAPKEADITIEIDKDVKPTTTAPYAHLHVHSQYSVLQSTIGIKNIVAKAVENEMPAVAITDLGNMFAAFSFVSEAMQNDILPIVGCDLFVTEDRTIQKFTKDNPDRRYTLPLLAKNKNGYENLSKMCSIGYIEGLYAGYPRIDKSVIEQYKADIICLTGGLDAEIPWLILNVGEAQAEEVFKYYHNLFGDDFYAELLRHGLPEEERVNETLFKFCKTYDVKYIASNNAYYLDKENADAHDVLLCVKDGELKSTEIGRGRGKRFGFPNQEFYFKTQDEMRRAFADLPEAIENISLIIDKIEAYQLKREILLPEFKIPAEFSSEDDYLKHLTFEGAKKRYKEITPEIQERLDHELKIIKDMGFPGYFLIVQDFTSEARKMGVSVGPGRGSAAGSAVAYCIGITNIDPIKYKLLFERFLNPERVSMPDIDIDFDDEGRGKVIDFVLKKYGYNQVAQIITYGSMAAKSAIRDVARVMDLPLHEADRIAKLVPDFSKLSAIFNTPEKELSSKFRGDQVDNVKQLREIYKSDSPSGVILREAEILEGSIRNTGTHACGVIITPDDMTKFIPVSTSKDSDLLITQFDNKVVESAGMLKMDFLGLKTLTIIKDALALVKQKHGVEIDPDEIPLDDEKTFELYQRGETNGTFQFESVGMQKNLRLLKPTHIEDLIAMNALYRPGPMQFIENFIRRKHGQEEVEYPHPLLETILKDTYGIMVYQEQIMQAAQILGGYTLGGADLLRRAMGKKKMDVMNEQREVFKEGAYKHHHIPAEKADEIFDIMMKFAEYGFNRSHSAAYSVVAFQTGYIKAHYPAEYMAAVLTNNMNDITKVSFFMEECKRMGIKVLGPDINESQLTFTVNQDGQIRFGLGAIKGVGENAVKSILKERRERGPFKTIFDVTKRIDLRAANKKTLEGLALAGGFDSFPGSHRAMFFNEEGGSTFLEKAIRFGAKHQESENSSQVSLFGEESVVSIPEPPLPVCEEWGTIEKLKKEKDVVGIFISGHPLDDYKLEIENFCHGNLGMLDNMDDHKGKEIATAVIITAARLDLTTKTGKPYGRFTMEDYVGAYECMLFGEDYLKFRKYIGLDFMLFVKGKIQEKPWRDSKELEFKINSMELLTDIREKLTGNITLKMLLNDINDEKISDLNNILEGQSGSCKVRITVLDEKEKLKTEFYAKGKGVSLTNEFLDKLNQLPYLEYELN